MAEKLSIGILAGGKSAEHEVSLQSALNVYEAMDRRAYAPCLIGIDKSGRWLIPRGGPDGFILDRADPSRVRLSGDGFRAALLPQSGGLLYNLDTSSVAARLDAVFPVLHGPLGEDGTVQGLLRLADIPFVGCGVLASAAGMDKDVCKRLLRDAGIPVARWITMHAGEPRLPFDEAAEALGLPLFIKPANLGSSVGVNKARTGAEYDGHIARAFQYDSKVLVEEAVTGRELECAVLDGDAPAASVPGEVIPRHDFYSYRAKYLEEDGASLIIPAPLSRAESDAARSLALRAFAALGCEGLSRVDMFLKEDGGFVVNEINTMPGFTRVSMYPKLWESSGLSYAALIDRLVTLARGRFEREKRLRTSVLD